ncbi:MAG: glycogen/starch/alpha-glucan phosphorylase [Desulfobacterales bacterium]|nr:glycogen/starch/alpha-glucan phosphorylase [Desulfobacterales bacterium]MBF0395574.1 glycogen/starch/alpha-glucan phosphorylase [Desulfobacterales bacterium]
MITIIDIKQSIEFHLKYSLGKTIKNASKQDIMKGVSLALRNFIIDGLIETEKRQENIDSKQLYYLSMEFLIGRSLRNNLSNLLIYDKFKKALELLNVDIDLIFDEESDAALGNGGLGRLAACFLDSIASLNMAGFGYGINYEFGLFKQEIQDGHQLEKPDRWSLENSPWLIHRPEYACVVPVFGRIEHAKDKHGNYNPMWLDWELIIGIPYDLPIVGYEGKTINFLRLFSARSSNDFNIKIFNQGDYIKAVQQKIESEAISKVLYPSDSVIEGKRLRLMQEYFLVACSIRDITNRYFSRHQNLDKFEDKIAIQMNDTHPALSVVELMRLFIDEHNISWDRAWEITQKTISYTNHTLLPEALEKWSVRLMQEVLPRHLQIIYEINNRFLNDIKIKYPNDDERLRRMSIIEETDPKLIRMSHIAIIGSHAINGVAELHTKLIKEKLVPDFFYLYPDRFFNVTNGISHRRWLIQANPDLSHIITQAIGEKWIDEPENLMKLVHYASDSSFQEAFAEAKKNNKKILSRIISDNCNVSVDAESIFDIHAKRIHEYKRQLLNVLEIIHTYLSIIEDGKTIDVPRTYIFSGKAAPGYFMAKQIIKLIHSLGDVVNHDSRVNKYIRVVFLPDFKVSLAERIYPAADISQQISTAGTEASGTGNMKMAISGAVTVGTMDGANIEIGEAVGNDNIYFFGLNAEEINLMKNSYSPKDYYNKNFAIKRVMDSLKSKIIFKKESDIFVFIYNMLINEKDIYFHLADFESYCIIRNKAFKDYIDFSSWNSKAIINISRMGKFTSDRSIRNYSEKIWNL